jgi:hypothetical protein
VGANREDSGYHAYCFLRTNSSETESWQGSRGPNQAQGEAQRQMDLRHDVSQGRSFSVGLNRQLPPNLNAPPICFLTAIRRIVSGLTWNSSATSSIVRAVDRNSIALRRPCAASMWANTQEAAENPSMKSESGLCALPDLLFLHIDLEDRA